MKKEKKNKKIKKEEAKIVQQSEAYFSKGEINKPLDKY